MPPEFINKKAALDVEDIYLSVRFAFLFVSVCSFLFFFFTRRGKVLCDILLVVVVLAFCCHSTIFCVCFLFLSYFLFVLHT